MKQYFILLLLNCMLLVPLVSISKEYGLSFIENEGQWNDTIRYKAELGNGALFLTDQGFVYHFIHEDDLKAYYDQHHNQEQMRGDQVALFYPQSEKQSFRHHAYKVTFLGAQKGPVKFKGEHKRSWYRNYFIGKDSTKWQSKVALYGRVKQQEVYPGIDMVIYQREGSVKYDFIVAPGANPKQILLEFEGVRPQLSEKGGLVLKTSVNTLIEQAPMVYQEINGERTLVPSRYKLHENRVSVELLEAYDKAYPLIIDPTVVFATYSGSTGESKLAYASTYDSEGNFYLGALVSGVGWPTTVGAFQSQYEGSEDICINKYNHDGSMLLFSTYLGGGGPDVVSTMMVNSANELIVAARTRSFDMPTLPSSFDDSLNLNNDLFIAKLNSTGTTLLASSYLGGFFNEADNLRRLDGTVFYSPIDISIGKDNSIWAITNVELNDGFIYPTSAVPLPITNNAIQPDTGGGASDVLIAQLNSDLSNLLFCSYFGGSGADDGMSIQFAEPGRIVISGVTNSPDLPTTAGVINPNYRGGASDGFVAVIDAQNYTLLHSTYIGTGEVDAACLVQIDENGNVLVTGQTMGNYPISPGCFNISDGDIFIDKLTPNLSNSILSTRLGISQAANPSHSRFHISSFLYDYCGRTYIGGYPRTGGMPTTADRLQTNPEGFWIGILEPDFTDLHFGTYYGTVADHPHSGITRFDSHGVIYQYICSSAPNYPVTANAAFPTKQNTGVDALAFKIDLEAEFVEAAGALSNGVSDTGCPPYTIHFQNNTYSHFPVEYVWDFGDGSPIDTQASPTHIFTDPGVYQVVLKAYSAQSCNLEDYDTLTITILSSEAPDIFTRDTAICSKQEQVKLWVGINNPSPDMYVEWLPEHAIEGPNNTDTVTVVPSEGLTYTVKVGYRSNDCALAERQIHINYAPRELTLLNPDTILCQGDTLAVEATGSEGYTYQWTPSIGVSDTSALDPYIIATESHTYILTATHPRCDDTSQSFALTVDTPYQASFTIDPSGVCVGRPVYLLPNPDPTTTAVNWTFAQQYREETRISGQYQHAFDQAGTYPVTLQMAFRACPDNSFTDSVTVYPLPEVNLGGDSSICLHGQPLYLKNLRAAPLNPYHQVWNTGDTSEVLKVVHPGTYTLSVTSEPVGCTTTESVTIRKNCYIDIPSAFTPNGDGQNDYYFPRQLLSESISQFRMQVFNRWGQLLFETNNRIGRGWDGRFNGQAQPVGVYLYRIAVDFSNGSQEKYKGNVTLIR